MRRDTSWTSIEPPAVDIATSAVVVDVERDGAVDGTAGHPTRSHPENVTQVAKVDADPRASSRRPAGRLWETALHPESIRTRLDYFNNSSKGLPRYYDYRSWTQTTFMFVDRAPGNYAWAWALCVVVATAWVCARKRWDALRGDFYQLEEFERMYTLIFTTLGFMLVFRMSRAAVRFWDCRAAWGAIIFKSYSLCDNAIVAIGPIAPSQAEELVRWCVAFGVGVKCVLRREKFPVEQVSGFLGADEVETMEREAKHYALYCARKMRRAATAALMAVEGEDKLMEMITKQTSDTQASRESIRAMRTWKSDAREVSCEIEYPQAHHPVRKMEPHMASTLMQTMEKDIAALIDHCGTMERIKATRLPIAYVSHLRTFLMGYILSLPFVYEGYWGWGTIPAVAAVAFALLGIEGAATECENPFSPKRTNHLGMDGFCEATQREIMELLSWWRLEEQ